MERNDEMIQRLRNDSGGHSSRCIVNLIKARRVTKHARSFNVGSYLILSIHEMGELEWN